MAVSLQLEALESLLRERGLGKALPFPGRRKKPPAPAGLPRLDALLGGGLPRGEISEFSGEASSGRTSLVFSALARATRAGELAAYIDASDCLDPRSALEAGVVLERLLWVRCGPRERPRYERAALREAHVEPAWRAANLTASAGGFGVIVLDLGGLPPRRLQKWRSHPWMRLRQALSLGPGALIVLAEAPLAGGAASLVLELSRSETHWAGAREDALLLDGVSTVIQPLRRRRTAALSA